MVFYSLGPPRNQSGTLASDGFNNSTPDNSVRMPTSDNREHPRTQEDAGALVYIDPVIDDTADFKGTIRGLATDGSFGGCSVILVAPDLLEPQQLCRVQLESVGPLQARVVWVRSLESSIHKVGLQYLKLIESEPEN